MNGRLSSIVTAAGGKMHKQPATMIAPTTFQFFATGQLGACLRLLRSEDSSVGQGNVGCI